ncbi:MAG TPA: hypothetical protein VFH76_02415 [Kribbella sp.]|nr:hypothetical protein [Kribbella sp.]
MALIDSYATLAELKSRLRIAESDEVDDDGLTAALAVASRGIESCCNRQFNDAGSATARLFHPPAVGAAEVDDFSTIVGLLVETDPLTDGTFTSTWAASDYELRPLNGVVGGVPGWPYWRIRPIGRRFTCWTDRATLRVTARWGWATVPAPIKEATLILAEDVFKLKDSPFGAGGYGEYGRIRARENPNVWLRIAPYVRDAVLVA